MAKRCALTAFACGADLPDMKVGVDASAKAGVVIDAEGDATKGFVSQEFPIDDSTTDRPEATCDFTLTDSPQTLVDFPMSSRDATAATKSTPVPTILDPYLPH